MIDVNAFYHAVIAHYAIQVVGERHDVQSVVTARRTQVLVLLYVLQDVLAAKHRCVVIAKRAVQ